MRRSWLLILLLLAASTLADERILSYHSDIHVRADGWIDVTETIQVRAEGNQIRRGIYRDYPTSYVDSFGNDHEVLYEPRSVIRNGEPETLNAEEYRNGVRTYFGRADRFLDPGEHTYVYRYEAGRMLGFFDDKDELWWNVTGNGWAFPIDKATATFRLASTCRRASWMSMHGRGVTAVAKLPAPRSIVLASRPMKPPGYCRQGRE
jgi:hypothetical protein